MTQWWFLRSASLASAQVSNLHKGLDGLRDTISSKSVSIDSFTFPSLAKTVDSCVHHLPGDVDQALICFDVPSLLHGIGCEFSSNQDTREYLYQNNKSGISSFALTLRVLPSGFQATPHHFACIYGPLRQALGV
jgi:hypothetical protein